MQKQVDLTLVSKELRRDIARGEDCVISIYLLGILMPQAAAALVHVGVGVGGHMTHGTDPPPPMLQPPPATILTLPPASHYLNRVFNFVHFQHQVSLALPDFQIWHIETLDIHI